VHRYPCRPTGPCRPAARRVGIGLAAAALASAAWLPGAAAASTGWQVAFQAHTGASTIFNGLVSVSASGKASAWAVGGTDLSGGTPGAPLAEQWNGTSWQAATLPGGLTGTLGAVSTPAPNDAWAVSQLTGYALHWDGTSWSVARTWPEPQLAREITGVTAFSPADVWVFGGSGAFPGIGTWHLRGSTWHKVTGLAKGISFASALSRSDMWAIGADNVAPEDILLHYNGTTWQQLSSPALTGLQFTRILAVSDSDVWVIGSPGGGPPDQLLHFDGSRWTSVPVTVPQSVQLVSIASDGNGGLWFSGFGTSPAAQWAVHRSAAGTWSSTRLTAGSTVYDLTLIRGTTSLWGAGALSAAPGADAGIWGHGPATGG
jgi:hypothetical protein